MRARCVEGGPSSHRVFRVALDATETDTHLKGDLTAASIVMLRGRLLSARAIANEEPATSETSEIVAPPA
eukprot:3485145-Alexandrium_andersonii.AAC.1